MKRTEAAFCKINVHGRFLAANKKFCRLFGFSSEAEVEWHYFRDLFRYENDWNSFISTDSATELFTVKLKNRKGRSFFAQIFRKPSFSNGKTIYLNTFQKISAAGKTPHSASAKA